MGRSPAFQFYPDKFLAGTQHLSYLARAAYMNMLCYIWLHSRTQYSWPDTNEAWSIATGLTGNKLESVKKELMHPALKLFKKRSGCLVSFGLQKEAKKQNIARAEKQKAANIRWHKEIRPMQTQCKCNADAMQTQCSPTPSPSSTPSPSLTPLKIKKELIKRPDLKHGAEEQGFVLKAWEIIIASPHHPQDPKQAKKDRLALTRIAKAVTEENPNSAAARQDQFAKLLQLLQDKYDAAKAGFLHKPFGAFVVATQKRFRN